MKTSLIRYRVADFLKLHPPFQFFSETDLLALAASGRVQFHQSEEFVYQAKQRRRSFVWVVQQGAVELLGDHRDRAQLHDLLGEGAVFGLEKTEFYIHSARTVGDVLLYALDGERFQEIVSRYPHADRFITAAEAVAPICAGTRTSGPPGPDALWLGRPGPAADLTRRRLLRCSPSSPIREVARLMASSRADVVAVTDAEGRPLGAVTVTALRDRVGTGEVSIEMPCSTIMAAGFPTLPHSFDTGGALLAMARGRTSFLGITADGSLGSPLEGIVTDRDLPLYCGINPARLYPEIVEARDAVDLARIRARIELMLADGLTEAPAVEWYCECLGELYAAILEKTIDLCRPTSNGSYRISKLGPDAAREPCWMLYGSAGRRELLMPLCPEIAVVYPDPPPSIAAQIQSCYEQWANRVLELLRASGFGPAQKTPLRLLLCRPLSGWKRLFEQLLADPIGQGIYDRRALFDLRPSAGDRSLAAELSAYLAERLRDNDVCVAVMANDAMVNLPPLTLFRDLVVETDGERHETLDLAHTLLDPLADVARVFALARNVLDDSATIPRLERAARSVRSRGGLFLAAADSFRIGLYYRARNAIRNQSEGNLVHPSTLRLYDHQVLKSCFHSVLDLLELTWANFDSIRDL